MLIAFEGLDACGKETQTMMLLDRLKSQRATGWTPELGSHAYLCPRNFPALQHLAWRVIKMHLKGEIETSQGLSWHR